MNFEQSKKDFEFINKLNGRKIISKGNHDYWWNTKNKMDKFFAENGFDTINILHNNHYSYDGYGICGTRGWISDNGELQIRRFWQGKQADLHSLSSLRKRQA